jgi:tetratricopeptide (TPR) repeat protein
MRTAWTRAAQGLAAAAVVLAAWLAGPAHAADDKAALRERALKLNDVTGDDPIKGQIKSLLKDEADTKKLLAVAVEMAKEKDQPFTYNAAYILARTAQKLKDLPAGEALYKVCAAQALKLKSGKKLSEAYLGRISLLSEHKKYDESEKVCQEFLEMGDADETVVGYKVLVLQAMVEILLKQDKIPEATKLVDNLVRERPNSWLFLRMKAEVQRAADEVDKAARTYEEVLLKVDRDETLDDDEKDYWGNDVRYRLSGLYVDLNKVDKAAEHLKHLLKKEPNNPTYNNDLGYIWADHDQNLAESEKLIRKALEEDRKQRKADPDLTPDEDHDNGAYLDSMGWVLYKQKKYDEAKKYLLDAVKDKDSQHVEIYEHLGDVYLALGEKAEALAAWKKGVEVAGKSKREQQRKAEVEKKIKANQ